MSDVPYDDLHVDPHLQGRPHRIRREEYDRMVASGQLAEERVELLRGVIVARSPQDPPHASPIQRLGSLLLPRLVGRAEVRVQLPLIACDESEPEPDLAVVPLGDYADAHPGHALLVIEVAGSSLHTDRHVKGPLYAASGFEEYWIVNLVERVVEVHRGPSPSGWGSTSRIGRDEMLASLAFPDVQLRIADFLR